MIKMIRNKNDCDGTVYIEILPRKFDQKHWNDDSVFFDEDSFAFLYNSFAAILPIDDFYYSFEVIPASNIPVLIKELQLTLEKVDQAKTPDDLREIYRFPPGCLNDHPGWNQNKIDIKVMLEEFALWLRGIDSECISFLGL